MKTKLVRTTTLFAAWCLIAAGGFSARRANADTPAAVLQVGQRATAIVFHRDGYNNPKDPNHEYVQDVQGSAFCITHSGYFITDAHVIKDCEIVDLMVPTGPNHVTPFSARVERRDRNLDLALLKVDAKYNFVPVDIAVPATLTRGIHVTAFGFPVHGTKFYDPNLPYSASVGSGHINAVFAKDNTPTDVLTDTGLGPGASGGPIVNDKGQLVGVLQKGRPGTRENLCRSARDILAFIAGPNLDEALHKTEVDITLPERVAASQAANNQTFSALIRTGLGAQQPVQATLTVSTVGTPAKVYHSELHSNGICEFHVPLLPSLPDTHTLTLTTSESSAARPVVVQVQDRSLTVGTRTLPLNDIARIDQGEKPVVVLKSGELIYDKVSGLEALQTRENGQMTTRDLRDAKRIVVRSNGELPPCVTYRLTVIRDGKTLAERTGRITLDGVPSRRMGQPMLIACGSAWATNDTGASQGHAADLSPATVQYIHNILDLFTGGAPSKILIDTNHWTFGAPFQEVLRAAGHSVTVSTDPGPFNAYDVIFVGGHEVDMDALTQYIEQGGKVYLAEGQGIDDFIWNRLLNHFGLEASSRLNPSLKAVDGFVYPSLFEGVKELKLNDPIFLIRTPQAKQATEIVLNQSETNLWAIYRSGEKLAPEPPPVAAAQPPNRSPFSGVHTPIVHHGLPRVPTLPPGLRSQFATWPVDQITPRMAQLATVYNVRGDKSSAGTTFSMQGWTAEDGGWFSYELNVSPKVENKLLLYYAAGDIDPLGFDVTVDGVKLPEPKREENRGFPGLPGPGLPVPGLARPGQPGPGSYQLTYLLSTDLLGEKDHVVVRVQAHPGKTTGHIAAFQMQPVQATP